jgi:hypothetical protein
MPTINLKLFILFYVNDTVFISESAESLHNTLNEFHSYFIQWNLHANVDKAKIMIFVKRRPPNKTFYFDNKVIEVMKEFKYLGIIFFSRSGSFNRAKKVYVSKPKKLHVCVGIYEKSEDIL